jgi:hypothetical protein
VSAIQVAALGPSPDPQDDIANSLVPYDLLKGHDMGWELRLYEANHGRAARIVVFAAS